jgi:hypothetical protein
MKVDDVAHDLCGLLQLLECYQEGDAKTAPSAKKEPVYLAETTFDLRKDYEAIKRDLQQHGHTVLPARPLPVACYWKMRLNGADHQWKEDPPM